MYLHSVLSVALIFGAFIAKALAQSDSASPTSGAPDSQATACGDLMDDIEAEFNVFLATDVYDCLQSVPFNPGVATRFIKYYNDTLQFQSTLAYLKSPPASYQQPPVDLIAGLDQIQSDIDGGRFANQYAFEATLQSLLYSAHDGHLQLFSGVLSAFSFGSPYELASVSLDGSLPKVYLLDDVDLAINSASDWQPSAIEAINGEDVVEYLTEYAAANTFTNVESNADWNQLMYSPALGIQGYLSTFGGSTTLYPGENSTFFFENGTNITVPWLATYNDPGPTGPLTTGGDFYNFFVLGIYPASFTPTPASATASPASATSSVPSSAPVTGWNSPGYPSTADVVQPDLSAAGGGYLTGYFLSDTLTGVLSIPSFEADDTRFATDFSDTIGEFLQRSQEAGMQKIVIDLQQNAGGNVLLAFDTFKQFFPDTDPYGGSRLRAQPLANVLGSTITNLYDTVYTNTTDYDVLAVDEWAATARLNAETGQNFTSWAEFYGPYPDNSDYFTTTQRYNLSSSVFDYFAAPGIQVSGYGQRPIANPQPYASEDIVLLSDGLCASACAVFMEMMHHEAGVRTVAVGGLPSHGPMQAPSGSRGALYYTSVDVDDNISFTITNNDTTARLFPSRQNDVYITSLGVNLRDQIRRGETIPLQFVYEAADCRIFFTPQNIYNFSRLWQDAADAAFGDSSLCVEDSTGYATYNTTDSTGPPSSALASSSRIPSLDLSRFLDLSGNTVVLGADAADGLPDRTSPIRSASGTRTSNPKYRLNIQPPFRNRKSPYKSRCRSGSKDCGGSKTGVPNPRNTRAPGRKSEPPSERTPERSMAETIQSGFKFAKSS